MLMTYIHNFVILFVESAPWLIMGLVIAGLMKWFVPITLLQKHMGNNSIASIVKAAIIGAPLPLCSCGVIPAAIGLRRSGASKSSTVSFLVATPETGVDSISVSYALLGPFFAIIRPISAILTAIYAGILVKLSLASENDDAELKDPQTSAEKSCCASKTDAKDSQPAHQHDLDGQINDQQLGLPELTKNALEFATGKLLIDITKWLLIGLLLAATIKTWVATEFLLQWGDGLLAMIVMALIGIPMYICATASTPLAAGFLAAGISPGAILVFMLAGPATNIATMGMIKQEMGAKVLIAYLTSLLTASLALGYFTNWIISVLDIHIPMVAASEHAMETSMIYLVSAALLAGLMIKNSYQQLFQK